MTDTLPYPSVPLMQRVGYLGVDDPQTKYRELGANLFEMVRGLAGEHVDLSGARVLDLGCGAGRVMRHWIQPDGSLVDDARLVGVDVDAESIDWVNANLAPSVSAVVGGSRPPLPFDDGSFDVVFALSLFTHLDVWWAEWIAEVHRLLRPGGVAILTVLEPFQMEPIFGVEPDGREGIVTVASGRPWDVGGPIVFHAPWWLEKHWGRGFAVQTGAATHLTTEGRPVGQSATVLIREPGAPMSADEFAAVDEGDEHERLGALRGREVRALTQGGPAAFDADHWLASAARAQIEAGDPALGATGLDIAAADDMYRVNLEHGDGPATVVRSYFATGLEVVSVVDQIVAWRFGGWEGVGSMLDFAAGYGRNTRFFVQRMPAGRVAVGEIQPAALQFQSINFGVEPVPASAESIELDEGRTFDLVVVVSLFTHLPRATWREWLARLWERTAPDGVLVFSTHNSEPAPEGVVLDDEGFWFREVNEIPSLDTAQYGTTYVSDAFVRSAIADVCDESAATTQRLVRAFGSIQDVYVVSRSHVPAAPLVSNSTSPVGAVDRAVRHADGTVRIHGWAGGDVLPATRRPGLFVTVDGVELDAVRGERRTDVATVLGRPWDLDLVFSGWHVDVPAELVDAGTLTVEVEHEGTRVVLLSEDTRTALARLVR